ncbi:MAG TPA: isochorismate lyase [Rubrobacter sp.]|nr:isochorismate lyase [Rubrobacter sp.]
MKSPEDCESIEDVRLGIDALDREIITLLGRRARYVETAARFKTSESSVRAPERQRTMLETRRRWAEEEGLSPEVIDEVYRTLIFHFIDRELNRWQKSRQH